jgi:hypothetical protein
VELRIATSTKMDDGYPIDGMETGREKIPLRIFLYRLETLADLLRSRAQLTLGWPHRTSL